MGVLREPEPLLEPQRWTIVRPDERALDPLQQALVPGGGRAERSRDDEEIARAGAPPAGYALGPAESGNDEQKPVGPGRVAADDLDTRLVQTLRTARARGRAPSQGARRA